MYKLLNDVYFHCFQQGFSCQNGVGPCISFEISPGGHRILSAYIHRGSRMTVHLHSFGYASNFQVSGCGHWVVLFAASAARMNHSESAFKLYEYAQVFIKSNEVPTEQNHDFKVRN